MSIQNHSKAVDYDYFIMKSIIDCNKKPILRLHVVISNKEGSSLSLNFHL